MLLHTIQLTTLYKWGHIKNKESRFLTFIDCVRTRVICPMCSRDITDLTCLYCNTYFWVWNDPKHADLWNDTTLLLPTLFQTPFRLISPSMIYTKITSSCNTSSCLFLLISSSSSSSLSPSSYILSTKNKHVRFTKVRGTTNSLVD